MSAPRLSPDGSALVWSSPLGEELRLGLTAGSLGQLSVAGEVSEQEEASYAALHALPLQEGAFLPWALELGRPAAVPVHRALLQLVERARERGQSRAPLLRMQLLAGLARSTGAVEDLRNYLQEVERLAARDRTFFASRQIESDLLRVVAPVEPLDLLRFGIEAVQKIEEWLALRLAWRSLFHFRRWRRRAAKAWVLWMDRTGDARHAAETEGDVWEEEERRQELEYAERLPGALVTSGAENLLRRWQSTLASPLLVGALLAGPAVILALLGHGAVEVHPLVLALALLWIVGAIGLAHRFLFQIPTLLWGGGAGGLLSYLAALASKGATLFSGPQLGLWAGFAALCTAVLATRLPAVHSLPDRLARTGVLLLFVSAFHLGAVLCLISAWASLQPSWAEAAAATKVTVQGLILRVPVTWVLGTALGSITGSLGGLILNLKYPGPLTL